MPVNQRHARLKELGETTYDLLIIGGGITGSGIALDAASRGLKVALLEKYDFAGGTSSRSTKLIHGGLRYLKQLEFRLVRNVGRERAVIHRLAPHLVRPVPMLLPVYRDGSLGRWSTAVALTIYDLLAGVKKEERYRWLPSSKVLTMVQGIRKDRLQGGALYTEYRTDDARLTLAVLSSASARGAVCLNYLCAEGFLRENGTVTGVEARDLVDGKPLQVRARQVVSAAGPWVDQIRGKENDDTEKRLQLTKGVHLVFDGSKIPVDYPMYTDTGPDGRMFFLIPRDKKVYVGTTDTLYNDEPDNPVVSTDDAAYLLTAVHRLLPELDLRVDDIESSWAGVRPLLKEAGKAPSELSRRDEIWETDSGLISIAGGKLTGYRTMARQVVDRVMHRLTGSKGNCKTATLKLAGHIPEEDLGNYLQQRIGESSQAGFTPEEIRRLVFTYGTGTDVIIELAFDLYGNIKDQERRLLHAELLYGVEQEWVQNISDFFIRRTGMLYFDRNRVLQQADMAADILAELLDQSPEQKLEDLAYLQAALQQAVTFG